METINFIFVVRFVLNVALWVSVQDPSVAASETTEDPYPGSQEVLVCFQRNTAVLADTESHDGVEVCLLFLAVAVLFCYCCVVVLASKR